MGSASSSSRFLGANMAKGMSKLVRVTWRDAGESISAPPSPSSSVSLGAARRWGGIQQVHAFQLTTPPSGSCLETPPVSPASHHVPTASTGPWIQLWKPDPQQFSNKCSSLAELRRTSLSQVRLRRCHCSAACVLNGVVSSPMRPHSDGSYRFWSDVTGH